MGYGFGEAFNISGERGVVLPVVGRVGIESAKTQTARDRGVIIISNIKHLIEEKENGIT